MPFAQSAVAARSSSYYASHRSTGSWALRSHAVISLNTSGIAVSRPYRSTSVWRLYRPTRLHRSQRMVMGVVCGVGGG